MFVDYKSLNHTMRGNTRKHVVLAYFKLPSTPFETKENNSVF
jgi:hypothetical protein